MTQPKSKPRVDLNEPTANPGKDSPKSPSGDSFFKDVDEHRRRRGPRGHHDPLASLSLAQQVAHHEAQHKEAKAKAESRRRAERNEFEERMVRRAAEIKADPYCQAVQAFDRLLDVLRGRNIHWAAEHQRLIEDRYGLRIELAEGWQSKLPADPLEESGA